MTTLNTPQDPRNTVDNPMGSGWYRTIPLAAIILGFVMVAGNYGALPDSIPIHFNGRGEVDGYGSKLMLWILRQRIHVDPFDCRSKSYSISYFRV